MLVVDTLRADALGYAGGGARTPNVDALAKRGASRFALASFHNTSMSMGSMFTGRTPSLESGSRDTPLMWTASNWCGLARYARPEDDERACVPGGLDTLGERMREAGYQTIGVASNPLTFEPYGFAQGFDAWREVGRVGPLRALRMEPARLAERRAGGAVTEAALRAVDARTDDRIFLYVHYMDAHDWNIAGHSYDTGVEATDAAIGRLLAGLEERGLLEGASIVFTSDHGEALDEPHLLPTTARHTGAPSFEQVLQVPLIVVDAPRVASLRAPRSEDTYRLLLAMAGQELGAPSDLGASDLLVSERLYQVYRDARFKSFWRRGDGAFHLVDLENDPDERRDVAEAFPEVASRHRSRMAELTDSLAARDARRETLQDLDAVRLRVLGYLE